MIPNFATRDFISPVLAAALLVARSVMPKGGNLFMRPEYHIVGKMAWGPIDYIILYYTLAVVIAEVRQRACVR